MVDNSDYPISINMNNFGINKCNFLRLLAFSFTITAAVSRISILTVIARRTAGLKTLTKASTSNPSYEGPENTVENHDELILSWCFQVKRFTKNDSPTVNILFYMYWKFIWCRYQPHLDSSWKSTDKAVERRWWEMSLVLQSTWFGRSINRGLGYKFDSVSLELSINYHLILTLLGIKWILKSPTWRVHARSKEE